jgi:hypothetical protein
MCCFRNQTSTIHCRPLQKLQLVDKFFSDTWFLVQGIYTSTITFLLKNLHRDVTLKNCATMSHKSPFQNSSESERLEQNFKNKTPTKCNFSVLPVCCDVVFPLKTLGSKHSHYSIINRNRSPPSFIHGTRKFKTLFKNMMTISYSCTFIDRFFSLSCTITII